MISYGFAVIIGAVILLCCIIYVLVFKRRIKKLPVICAFIIYLTVVACVTLFPIVYDSPVEYSPYVTWYNFVPFKTIFEAFKNGLTVTSVLQTAGNIIMAIPFGIIALALFKVPRWWQKLILALSLPLAIELSQMLIGYAIGNMYRNIDVDDVILNTAGVYLGYGIYKLLPDKIKRLF